MAEEQRLELKSKLATAAEKILSSKSRGITVQTTPYMALRAKFPGTLGSGVQFEVETNCKKRYSCCTWIDNSGCPRCSCIGIKEFRIKAGGN